MAGQQAQTVQITINLHAHADTAKQKWEEQHKNCGALQWDLQLLVDEAKANSYFGERANAGIKPVETEEVQGNNAMKGTVEAKKHGNQQTSVIPANITAAKCG